MTMSKIVFGDCRKIMQRWISEGVRAQMCVTSPPYFGLRDYGVAGQLGLETTPDEYVNGMLETFRLVWDLLADDGTLWLNLGDSYAASGRGGGGGSFQDSDVGTKVGKINQRRAPVAGFKQKDILGIPWRVAFALQADGWYLRQDIIWAKPNPMPESVRDRCTKSHEYLFMLSKSPKYYYDAAAIRTPAKESSIARWSQPNIDNQIGSNRVPGKTNGNMKAVGGPRADKQRGHSRKHAGFNARWDSMTRDEQMSLGANRRDVWFVATRPYKGAHFATFPPDLIEPCILAGSRVGDIVLDPFMGSGTTAQVAKKHKRHYLGCELNPNYRELCLQRLAG